MASAKKVGEIVKDEGRFMPITDLKKFRREQDGRTATRRKEEHDEFVRNEKERISASVGQINESQCNERLEKLNNRPDWYYQLGKIAKIKELKKAAVEQERLYPGARDKRREERMLREELERQELEKERLKAVKTRRMSAAEKMSRNPYTTPEGPDLNASNNGENQASVKHGLAYRNLNVYGSSKAREERLNGAIKSDIYTSYRGFVEASTYNDYDILMELFPKLDAVTDDHWKELLNEALGIAAEKGHLKILKAILERGGDPNRMSSGYPAFVQSAINGHLECLKLMAEEHEADIDVQDANGFTSLIHAVDKRHTDVVQYLIDCGVSRDIKTFAAGYSSLHIAAAKGYGEIIEKLISMGSVSYQEMHDNYTGETPLMKAIDNGRDGCMALLFEDTSMVCARDHGGRTALHHAVRSGNYEAIEYLINELNVDVNEVCEKGQSALIMAALKGDLKSCRILGALKATEEDLSSTDEDDENQIERRENPRFFGAEADPNIQDIEHETALHHAVKARHFDIIHFLCVELGADMTLENSHLETAVEWVKKMKLEEMGKDLSTIPAIREEYNTVYKREIHLRNKRKARRERMRNKGSDSEDFSSSSEEEDD